MERIVVMLLALEPKTGISEVLNELKRPFERPVRLESPGEFSLGTTKQDEGFEISEQVSRAR